MEGLWWQPGNSDTQHNLHSTDNLNKVFLDYVTISNDMNLVKHEPKMKYEQSPYPGVKFASMIGSLTASMAATVLKSWSRCDRAVITAVQINARW